ncbi:MAG: penicillin-binding protein 2 [Pseudomonadota bacterium]|nr:penicillin-binding protein 2 [Pseudomonadota bacterium]
MARLSGDAVPALVAPGSAKMRELKMRQGFVACAFLVAFAIIAAKLVWLGVRPHDGAPTERSASLGSAISRPDVTDRKGRALATDISMGSLFANPDRVVDVDDAVEQLAGVLPDIDAPALRRRLRGEGKFVWVARELTPRQQEIVHELGLPGFDIVQEPHRVYPAGNTASQVLGFVDVDNRGLAGIETYIDRSPLALKAGDSRRDMNGQVALSLDLGAQYALRSELDDAMKRYRAKAAAGLVMDVHSGEVVAMASLPDYDPNRREQALDKNRLNRLTSGVYELGSVFKLLTVAGALDSGAATLEKTYDATQPIQVSSFTINDFHAKRRVLSVPEIFIYSSNIGSAKMAVDMGVERHRAFLARMGLMKPVRLEVGETAAPIIPQNWRSLTSMTAAFGHGLSVTPLQFAAASAALVNGGYLVEPTFLKRSRGEARLRAERVVSQRTSEQMRYLLRLNVTSGSGRRADAEGYRVGGKTGTAEKVVNGRYSRQALLTSFLAAFPVDAPEYVVFVMLDEPQRVEETGGEATAGLNAAPTVRRIVERVAPLLGVLPEGQRKPVFDEPVPASY